jgi:hypothetical protein
LAFVGKFQFSLNQTPWLDNTVRQKLKTPFIAFGFTLAFLVASAAVRGEATTLESQLRADIEAFVRSKAPQPVQQEAMTKTIDQAVSEVKRLYPAVLKDEGSKADAPTDEALTQAHGDLERVGRGAPLPVMVSFYAELWKGQHIGPKQRIIFERLMRAITEAAERQKKNG